MPKRLLRGRCNNTLGFVHKNCPWYLVAATAASLWRFTKAQSTAQRRTCLVFAARWGGDEFVVICTHDIHDDPDRVENEIKTCLSDVVSRAKVAYDLSCSVGYARCDSPNEPMSDFVSRADQALYASKRSSR